MMTLLVAWLPAAGLLGIFVPLAMALRRLSRGAERRRREAMREAAALTGLAWREPGRAGLDETLRGASAPGATRLISASEAAGRLAGLDVVVHEAFVRIHASDIRNLYAVFRSADALPRFRLTAKDLMENDLPGLPTQDTISLEVHGSLGSKYRLCSAQREAALQLLKPAVVLFFETTPERWDVIGNGVSLVVAPHHPLDPWDSAAVLGSLIRQSGEVARLFLTPADTR